MSSQSGNNQGREPSDSDLSDVSGSGTEADQDEIIKKTQAEILSGKSQDIYNPNQDKEKVRGTRKILRKHQETANAMKDKASAITAEEFDKEVLELDHYFKDNVRAPAEATIDSRALLILSETALKKSKSLRKDVNAFDTEEFILRFQQVMSAQDNSNPVGPSSDEEENAEEIDWLKVGKKLMRFSRRAPAMDLMYGPLEIQHKKRRTSQRSRLEKNDADRKEPELIQNNEIERSQAEMSRLIAGVALILSEKGGQSGMNLFQFFINPNSFAQSVENLFCLSFLIRDGKAAIDTHDDQEVELQVPVVYATEPAGVDLHKEGFTKTQAILEFTMQDWKEAIELFNIRESIISHREDSRIAQSTKRKWH
ncbi:hypothetical protein O181_039270 [Austropuccinia psidii MF-1]|uniref:Non-structural maintenance of chromosomes element 4 n=1 Tax=Austropuccinia psidii MF-1 TaxID=1389203 RepID=A0A9Q3HF01_9BASI|nr:hypothetical protein [Austropuccinia psidii MF-1]